ncbi:MAG: hypothetical protein WAO91_04645 [Candidatus Nitrosotenuis sp.]
MELGWQHKEEIARKWLSKELGIHLKKDTLILGKNQTGGFCTFEYDILSDTGYAWNPEKEVEVAGMVKAVKLNPNGPEFQTVLGDCFLLTKIKAKRKYMILTNPEFYEHFKRRTEGILGEITLVYLDPEKHRHLLE